MQMINLLLPYDQMRTKDGLSIVQQAFAVILRNSDSSCVKSHQDSA